MEMFFNFDNAKYFSYFVLCPLSKVDLSQGQESLPVAVSLVGKNLKDHNYGNKVKVQNREYAADLGQVDKELREQNKFGVCIKPIHSNFSSSKDIIEFIELYKILGASHFTFYNISISPQTSCVLQKYIDQGTAQVLTWNSNFTSESSHAIRLFISQSRNKFIDIATYK